MHKCILSNHQKNVGNIVMGNVIVGILVIGLCVTDGAVNDVLAAENTPALEGLLHLYQLESSSNFSVQTGSELWRKEFVSAKSGDTRSCTTCHTSNLGAKGRHIKTKKVIEPLAPSVNGERLAKTKTIKKWLKRNCKWTMGRECSAEEKGHLLTYIQSQ